MESYSNPTIRAARRYYWQFGLSMAAYVIVVFLSRWMWHDANGRWQTVVALFPMIPAVFVFASIVRYLLATDELMRRIAVISLALAGGATALIAVTYGLLEGDGLPRPSAWWTRSEEHTSELQSLRHLVCRLLLEKKKHQPRWPAWLCLFPHGWLWSGILAGA